ncbi:MAG: hypothetical protein IJ168_00245 [Eubacterium sp.]|nr:hypothetical protein [Eubacterium sp.]
MAISPQQKDVLNQANFSEGGINFISDLSKINIQSEPILVVGLGGSGIDALLRVKAKVNEIFKTGKDVHSGKRKTVPDNIKFIGIDTDKTFFPDKASGQPGRMYRGMYIERDEELNIGTTTLSGFVQHAVENKRTYVTDWLASGLAIEDASGGANGVRQIARLCLFNTFDTIYNKFTSTINALTASSRNDPNSKLYVYVLGGISGGTGSGTFLDIPYIIQSAAKSALGMTDADLIWDRLVMFGYFVTPDINEKNKSAECIGRNGYAAMKELDYLMGLEDRHETFVQDYGPRTIYSRNKPYSLVNFVTSYFEGGNPVSDPYDTAMQVIAENVIFFIANDANNDSIGPWSFQNNVNKDIIDMVASLSAKGLVKPVGYRYGIIGSSGRILPVQDIMTCLASKLLDRVNEMWEAHGEPSTQEVQQIVGPAYFGFDPGTLTQKLMANVPFSFSSIKQEPQSYPASAVDRVSQKNSGGSPDFIGMYNQIKAQVDANFASDLFMKNIEDNFTDKLRGFFENTAPLLFPDPLNPNKKPNYGPRFANDILVGVGGGTQLNAYDYCFQQLNMLVAANNDINARLQNLQAAAQQALQELQSTLFNKKKYYGEYMTAMETLFGTMLQQHINTRLIKIYQDLRDMIIKANHEVFGVIYETLTSLHKIFDENMDIMGNVDRRKTYEGVVMSWYVVSFTDVNSKIQEILDKKGLEVPVNDLYKMIWDKRESWSTDDVSQYTVFDDLTNFLTQEFTDALDLGLEAFLEEKYNREPNGANSFEEYIQYQFDHQLTSEAAIMFNDRPGFKVDAGSTIPGRMLIQVPKQCNRILTAVKAAHAGKKGEQVAESDSRSRITYTKALYGVPIYSYAIIENYEKVYESQLVTGAAGVHLYQHGDVNWRDLPALCPESTWSANYQNPREKERVAKANAIFDEAVKYGVIRFSEPDDNHIAVFAGNIDIEALRAGTAKTPSALGALCNQLKSYLNTTTDLPGDVPAYAGDGYQRIQIQHGKTLESAKLWFASSYQLIKRVEKENAKYAAIEKAVEEISEDMKQFEAYTEFAQAYLTKILVRQGPKYLYNPANDAIEAIELVSNSQLKNKEYPHFDLFNLLYNEGKLPTAQFAQFKKDIEAKFQEFENSDYDTVYVPTIQALREELESKKQTAEFNRDFLGDAEAIITFYNIVIAYLRGIQ